MNKKLSNGVYICGEPEFIGKLPIQNDLTEIPEKTEPSIAEKEWKEYHNNAIYVFNGGIVDSSWKLEEGGIVMIRVQAGGWYIVPLEYRFGKGGRRDGKERDNWFVTCNGTKVPIRFDPKRKCWVSTFKV